MIKRRCSAVKRKKKRPLRQSANAPPFLQLVAAGEKRINLTLGFSPSEGGALPPPGGEGQKGTGHQGFLSPLATPQLSFGRSAQHSRLKSGGRQLNRVTIRGALPPFGDGFARLSAHNSARQRVQVGKRGKVFFWAAPVGPDDLIRPLSPNGIYPPDCSRRAGCPHPAAVNLCIPLQAAGWGHPALRRVSENRCRQNASMDWGQPRLLR